MKKNYILLIALICASLIFALPVSAESKTPQDNKDGVKTSEILDIEEVLSNLHLVVRKNGHWVYYKDRSLYGVRVSFILRPKEITIKTHFGNKANELKDLPYLIIEFNRIIANEDESCGIYRNLHISDDGKEVEKIYIEISAAMESGTPEDPKTYHAEIDKHLKYLCKGQTYKASGIIMPIGYAYSSTETHEMHLRISIHKIEKVEPKEEAKTEK